MSHRLCPGFAATVLLGLLALLAGCEQPSAPRFGGYVEAEEIEVGSRLGGRVERVYVEEGDEVEAGATLVEFETDETEAELAEAQRKAERLEVAVAKLEAGPRPQEIEKARQDVAAAIERTKNAQLDHQRALETPRGVISREKIDDLASQVQVALAEQKGLEAVLALLEEGTREEDKLIAQRELEEAQAHVQLLKVRLQEGTVTAPVDAVVEVMDLQPGDLVAGGSPVATLVRKDQIWVRCFVPTTQITLLEAGNKVRVTVDGRPGESYEGTVLRINRQAEYTPRNVQTFEQRQDQVFAVKVRLADPNDVLRPGMAATVWLPEG